MPPTRTPDAAAHERLRYDRAPRRVYWEVTRCRAAAVAARNPLELDHAAALRLLDGLAAFGDPLPHLVLTGGDPLKRPDLFALIAAARARGLRVAVSPYTTPLVTPAIRQVRPWIGSAAPSRGGSTWLRQFITARSRERRVSIA